MGRVFTSHALPEGRYITAKNCATLETSPSHLVPTLGRPGGGMVNQKIERHITNTE